MDDPFKDELATQIVERFTPQFYVEIVAYEDESVESRRGPFSAWKADKIDDGLNINLNHEAYFTRIVPATDEADQDAARREQSPA